MMQSGALATVRAKEPVTIMQIPDFNVKHPVQLTFVGQEVLEITLRIGLIVSQDHAQFQLDVVSADTGELISCASRHHVSLEDAMAELSDWIQRLQVEVWEATGPF